MYMYQMYHVENHFDVSILPPKKKRTKKDWACTKQMNFYQVLIGDMEHNRISLQDFYLWHQMVRRTCTQILCDKGELYLTGTLACNHSDCCSSIDETNKKEHFSVLFAKCVLLHMVGKGELEQTIDEEH